jgi:leucyl aminopeptidase
VALLTADPRTIDTDLIALPVFEGELPHDRWSEATGGEVARATRTQEFRGRLYEFFITPFTDRSHRATRLALIGAGPSADCSIDRARKIASALVIAARQRRIPSVALFPGGRFEDAQMLQAVAEGLALGAFDVGQYKTVDRTVTPMTALSIVTEKGSTAQVSAVKHGRVLADCTNLARQLVNEPGNALTPSVFTERVVAIARAGGLSVEVLEHADLIKLGMGLILAVGRGSSDPPRLIVIRYEPPGAPAQPLLGFVGKGVTFDSGGLSLKTPELMDHMKDDMAGGAAVVTAMRAIAALQGRVRVVGVIPCVENMPGGSAFRPGDVITSASGKTVEVLNTDAEGRLILADALWHAHQIGATHLVDVATLTGACVIALGKITTGLFGTPPEWVDTVRKVADRAGDRCWPMPLFEEYRDQLKSDIADMVNVGGRPAGAITAAAFLKEFTGGVPWAHLDIAGTAWNDEMRPYQPKGATGAGVRTLAELALSWNA